jgi:ATP-dependent helicase HrpB
LILLLKAFFVKNYVIFFHVRRVNATAPCGAVLHAFPAHGGEKVFFVSSRSPMLSVLEHRLEIINAVKRDKCLIIRAPTGSGKSTQVPQVLLDSGLFSGRILVLQPRRLAARMLAMRVAQERNSEVGNEIGFQTRFETMMSRETRVCFITEGILPRMMLTDKGLDGVSAVIFDEFHERSLSTDIGLALIRDLRRPGLALIVMSATIDTAPLAEYLGGAVVIESSGRTFPIDIRYASSPAKTPVWDSAAGAARALIATGAQGDIVVFMPGVYEIRRTVEAVSAAIRSEPVTVLPLYGDLPADRQRSVMEPSAAKRKIVVATNIAETSLTIPGVRHVIDSGVARVNRYDPGRGFNTLYTEPISIDSADQRAGRAGREAAGICIRLWSESSQSGRARSLTPEVLRVDLAETLLSLRLLGYLRPQEFPWFERPGEVALNAAHELLVLLGACDAGGHLTDAGKEMSMFPMHPRLARLLCEAGKRKAVRLATFTAALLSERSFLAGKPEYPEQALVHEISSDFYGQYCLLEKISASGFDPAVCMRYSVNAGAARNVLRTQALFMQHCRRFGMHTHDASTAPFGLAESLLLAYPDHLGIRKDKGTLICTLRNGRHGELAKDSLARSEDLVIAADIRETKDRHHDLKTVLSLATGIRREWIERHFSEACRTESIMEWNPANLAVENRVRTLCLEVVLEEKSTADIDIAAASGMLAETILEKSLTLSGWDQAANEWIGRVAWVAEKFPDQGLPRFTDEDRKLVVHSLCEGEFRYARVKDKPVLPFLHELVSAQQLRFVDAMAPQAMVLPSGRRLRIAYVPGAQPRGRARIQDLYGMNSTPRVAQNRVPVLIEVLAPNNRPVQITDDLSRFWKVHYPDIRKTLSRRYPRHEWR